MLPIRQAIESLTPYVPGRSLAAIAREGGPADLVKLNQNENALGPSPAALATIAETLSTLHQYPDGTARELRDQLAGYWDLPAEWFLVGNGSDEIFRLLAETYLETRDSVVVPAPSFAGYPLVAQLMGAEVVRVPLLDDAMDLTLMVRVACGAGARFIFLCRPNSPTGGVFTEDALHAALAELPDGIIVILDEAYREFDETSFDSREMVLRYPNLIVTRTFSKIYGLAGLRLGYGIMRPELSEPLYRVRDPFSVNGLALAAGAAALDDAEHVESSRAVTQRGKVYFYELFEALDIRYVPTQANFVLFYTDAPSAEVANGLLERGVVVRSCASFGLPTALRVTIGTMDQNERFAAALQDLLAAR